MTDLPPRAPDTADLAALELPTNATAVLAVLGDEGWTTSVALAARLGITRSVVSQAVHVLVEMGLVERRRGRRPAPLRLHPESGAVLDRRLHELTERREDAAERADRAATWLRAAVVRAAAGPAPVHQLDPAGAPPDWRLETCRTSYDEVCRPDSPSILFSGRLSRRSVRRRLLVTGSPPDARGQWLTGRGVELRVTEHQLPRLLVADGVRARVEVSVDGRGPRKGWTHDGAQVEALQRLFELWWAEAEPWRAAGG